MTLRRIANAIGDHLAWLNDLPEWLAVALMAWVIPGSITAAVWLAGVPVFVAAITVQAANTAFWLFMKRFDQ